jgi:hypothetical protein
MEDLTHLYGRNKAGANVVDLSGVNQHTRDNIAFNRKRNAEKAAKRAVMGAALNDQLENLNNTAWSEDQQYVSDLKQETSDWLQKTYPEHGEMAVLDDPALKKEFADKIAFIKRENDASHANIIMGNKMLTAAMESPDDKDPKTLGEFNAWRALPPAQRLRTQMPIITDRQMEFDEVFEKDFATEVNNLSVPTGHTGGINEETGKVTTYKGKRTPEQARLDLIESVSSNPKSRANKAAVREAVQEINEDLIPQTIQNEQGETIDNPEYVQTVNNLVKAKVTEQVDRLKPAEYTTSTSTFKSDKTDDTPVVTEVAEDERGHTREKAPSVLKEGDYIGEIKKNETTGDMAFQLKSPVYKTIDGKIVKTSEEAPGGEEIGIGNWMNQQGDVIDDVSEYVIDRKKVTSKVSREVGIQKSPKKNITKSTYIADGKVVEVKEVDFFDGAQIIKYHKGEVDKSKNGKFLREGDEGFKKKKAEDVETVVVKTKKGETYEVEVDDKIKQDFGTVFEKIGEAETKPKNKSISRADIKARANASGYSEAEYTKLLNDKGIEITD